MTDTLYDSAGREARIHTPYLASSAAGQPVPPSTNLFVPTQSIPRVKLKRFDGVGRTIAVIDTVDAPPASPGGNELWRTTTGYGGDRIDTTPPAGGTATSTIQDARGNTVELRHYRAGNAAGSPSGFASTTYQFNQKNKLASVTDAAGHTWQYFYDVTGNKIREIDPDRGITTTSYTIHGDVQTVTDGRGVTIAYAHDALGRKIAMRDGSQTGPKRAEWVYDRLANGTDANDQLIKSIRYDGDAQYIQESLGFTVDYKPTSVRYTIPDTAVTSDVDGSYAYVYSYREDGSTATIRLPALGDPDLGLETLTYDYNRLGRPTSLTTSLGATLVAAPDPATPATEYTSLGELAAIHLRYNGGPRADAGRVYDTSTRRLAQIWTTRATGTTTASDLHYVYDPIGNITRISDLTSGDHQCFTTDHLRRLTQAWTPSNADCTAAPTASALGGPAQYWHSLSYDAVGNRTRLQEFATATGTRDTTYTVPGAAHRLTATSTTDATGTRSRAFDYDDAGNMRSRSTALGTQTLTLWLAKDQLANAKQQIWDSFKPDLPETLTDVRKDLVEYNQDLVRERMETVSTLGQRRRPIVTPLPPWPTLAGTIHSPTYHHRHGTGAPDF